MPKMTAPTDLNNECKCHSDCEASISGLCSRCGLEYAQPTDFAAEVERRAFEWTRDHMKYADEKQVRDMCDSGRSQTYNTALHFANFAAFESTLVKKLVNALDASCHCETSECDACVALAAYDRAKREAGK